jgi:hypothetical protein
MSVFNLSSQGERLNWKNVEGCFNFGNKSRNNDLSSYYWLVTFMLSLKTA